MKIITPAEMASKTHPWGTTVYQDAAHAQWLSKKIINEINRKLKKKSVGYNSPYSVETDTCFDGSWPTMEQAVLDAFDGAGWDVSVQYEDDVGGTILVFTPKEVV